MAGWVDDEGRMPGALVRCGAFWRASFLSVPRCGMTRQLQKSPSSNSQSKQNSNQNPNKIQTKIQTKFKFKIQKIRQNNSASSSTSSTPPRASTAAGTPASASPRAPRRPTSPPSRSACRAAARWTRRRRRCGRAPSPPPTSRRSGRRTSTSRASRTGARSARRGGAFLFLVEALPGGLGRPARRAFMMGGCALLPLARRGRWRARKAAAWPPPLRCAVPPLPSPSLLSLCFSLHTYIFLVAFLVTASPFFLSSLTLPPHTIQMRRVRLSPFPHTLALFFTRPP